MTFPHKKITVFGATGFVGRYVVQRLAQLGVTVVAPTRNVEKAKFLRTYGDVGQIVPVACDVIKNAQLERVIAGSDAVVNLIGIMHPNRKSSFKAIHYCLPGRIAKIAHTYDVQSLVHVSAIGADPKSKSLYARTKGLGEQEVQNEFSYATILRPSIIFGPEDNFFNMFASMARISPILPLIGGGHSKFQPVYVGDVADAVIACLGNPATQGKIYELGGADIFTFKQLLEMMLEITGQKTCLVSLPFWGAKIQASVLQLLPKPLLTVDQVRLLAKDNVVGRDAHGLRDLGIVPTALDVILPTYLDQYQAGGKFKAA